MKFGIHSQPKVHKNMWSGTCPNNFLKGLWLTRFGVGKWLIVKTIIKTTSTQKQYGKPDWIENDQPSQKCVYVCVL